MIFIRTYQVQQGKNPIVLTKTFFHIKIVKYTVNFRYLP